MTRVETKPLNRLEIWVAEHVLPIFAAIAVLTILGAIAVIYTYQQQSTTAERVKVLTPQVTKVAGAICDRESLHHPGRADRCAERIRIGLINCKRVERCRAALLAAITYPPPARDTTLESGATEGGGAQNPSHAGQQPGPGSQPGHSAGGHGHGHSGGHMAPLAPSPAPSSPPATPPGLSLGNGHGNGQGGGPRGSPSGLGVELCALSKCADAEVGLPRGGS